MKKFALIILVLIVMSGCGNLQIERHEKSMGTILTLKAEGVDAQAAVDESFNKILALEREILSDTKKIEAAAGNGDFVKINREVFDILRIAQIYSELTDGAFDVTIGTAVDLWKNARKNSTLPTEKEIATTRQLVNFKNLELNEADCSARLKVAGMKLNLGGVAKGYAVDIAREIFDAHNVTNGLIDFGTSTIFAIGEKNIGLKNPRTKNEIAEVITIRDSAISTSGAYENFSIIEGQRLHHIINPKTCEPVATQIESVSVIVDGKIETCATVADILSTTVFIVGKERAEKILSNIGFPESVQIAIFVGG